MSSLTDTFQPGDVVEYRLKPISNKGLFTYKYLGSVNLSAILGSFNYDYNGDFKISGGEAVSSEGSFSDAFSAGFGT